MYSDWYYYCGDSVTGLRRKVDWRCGMNLQILMEPAGSVAGGLSSSKDHDKYYKVKFKGRTIAAHIVIWSIMVGEIPSGHTIDHIDGNSLNNKIENLRCVSKTVNSRNQKAMSTGTSGFCGVNISKYKGQPYNWKARWNDLEGNQLSKTFLISKYGNEEAFRLACEHRAKMIEELNEQGAGYSIRHGT